MSRIDDLIAQHCPDGVKFVPLGKVAEYSKERISAEELTPETFVGVDNLLPNKAGKVGSSYGPNTINLNKYNPGDILLGNIRPYLKKVWIADSVGGASGDVLVLTLNDDYRDLIGSKYLYYLLSSDSFFAYVMKFAKGAKMPRGDKASILKYEIQVPPICVQNEIVTILDRFTQLEAELEAELEARRRQYEYYRDSLLTFTKRGGVRLLALGNFATLVRGNGMPRKDLSDHGVGAIHY